MNGVRINGHFSSGGGDASVSAAAGPQSTSSLAGMAVQVEGTDNQTTVSDTGTFSLADVAPGPVRLRFTSSTVNTTTDLSPVAADTTVQVELSVTANTVTVLSQTSANTKELCHKEGNGTYHLIAIAPAAEAAHRAHGDAAIGEAVPGRPTMVFDASCVPAGPEVDIEKSTNGSDADSAPGPSITIGNTVTWDYVVTNTGTLPLTGIAVADDQIGAITCPAATLAPGASMICTVSDVAVAGQYQNLGSVTASWSDGALSGQVSDSDPSHYLGVTSTQGTRVTLCHKTGNGRYIEITVDQSAEAAHRAHGDGMIGDPVPGQAGKFFGPGCVVQ